MNKILLEDSFINANLGNFFKNKATDGTSSKIPSNKPTNKSLPTTDGGANQTEKKKYPPSFNWEKEYRKRIAENNAMSREARKPQLEIEQQFWADYFEAMWPNEAVAKCLHDIGALLKKDIQEQGFSKEENPLIAFFKLNYVQKNLILTKKINASTYKALHNAVVAHHSIADSEFYKANNYNIIYCVDLWERPAADIQNYILAQAKVLKRNATVYDVDLQNKNKRIFIELKKNKKKDLTEKAKEQLQIEYPKLPGMTSSSTTLNDFALVEAILKLAGVELNVDEKGKVTDGTDAEKESKKSTEVTTKTGSDIVDKLSEEDKVEAKAILQYIGTVADNKTIRVTAMSYAGNAKLAAAKEKVDAVMAGPLLDKLRTGRITKDVAEAIVKAIVEKFKLR